MRSRQIVLALVYALSVTPLLVVGGGVASTLRPTGVCGDTFEENCTCGFLQWCCNPGRWRDCCGQIIDNGPCCQCRCRTWQCCPLGGSDREVTACSEELGATCEPPLGRCK